MISQKGGDSTPEKKTSKATQTDTEKKTPRTAQKDAEKKTAPKKTTTRKRKKTTKKPRRDDILPAVTQNGTGDARRFEADLDANPNTRGKHYDLRAVDPGDNAVYIHNMLVALDLPPVNPFDPNQVEDRIREYFEFCAAAGRVPNMVGMANWLGVESKTLKAWKRGETDPEKYKIVSRMMTAFESLLVDYSADGKINVAMGIFLLKNWFGYRDMQQVEVQQNNPMGVAAPAQELAEKYLNLDSSDPDIVDVTDAAPADKLPEGDAEAETVVLE